MQAETAKQDIKALTGLRGIAALYVMEYHANFIAYFHETNPFEVFMCHGYQAVNLFFILSGFVMALTYGADFATGFERENYFRFLVKRLGRIYPLYIVMTFVCMPKIVQRIGLQGALTWPHIAANLALIQTWGICKSIDPTGWSISTELAAYLLFPFLTAILLFSRLRLAITGGLLALAALIFAATRSDIAVHEPIVRPGALAVWDGTTLYPLLICLACFSLGLLVWRAWDAPGINRLAAHPATGLIAVAATILLLSFRISDVLTVLVMAILIVTLATGKSPANFVLASPPVHWLGVISYSIYLVHWPILAAFEIPLHHALDHGRLGLLTPTICILTLATILLSALAHYLIERPGRTLSRRFLSRRRAHQPERFRPA
jgi:peptidoglycan/LPS O-acetylase OafA/YrhL